MGSQIPRASLGMTWGGLTIPKNPNPQLCNMKTILAIILLLTVIVACSPENLPDGETADLDTTIQAEGAEQGLRGLDTFLVDSRTGSNQMSGVDDCNSAIDELFRSGEGVMSMITAKEVRYIIAPIDSIGGYTVDVHYNHPERVEPITRYQLDLIGGKLVETSLIGERKEVSLGRKELRKARRTCGLPE